MSGLGFFTSLLITTFATAVVGCFFLIVAWASVYGERRAGQDSISPPLWTFTCAVLLDALAITLTYELEPNVGLALPSMSLVFCWVLLVGTLVLGRQRTGSEIGTLKVGSITLLVIGGLGVITLTMR